MTGLVAQECRNQVVDHQNSSLFFCLVMKEYLETCPLKCPYYMEGDPISMETVYYNNYELKCPFFHLVTDLIHSDKQFSVCGKTGKNPDPQKCS